MDLLVCICAGLAGALIAPWLQRRAHGASGWLLALVPGSIFVTLARHLPEITGGQARLASFPWVPDLGVRLSFHLDGLALTFALLISGIGALVVIYAGGYLAGDARLGRLQSTLLLFMSSMLGLVLSDNLITLFIFWELTSISSYLLIGFDHERPAARAAALQALLVTGIGGLALLAGFVLLGSAGGSYEFSQLVQRGAVLREHALYVPILLLVLLGAFTKSAQVPFHFWLPSAMEAPTPISAYLHSATMVKAGVYLLARLTPVLGDTDLWHLVVGSTGAVTLMLGALLALAQTDLKRILAYTTVSALGMLVLLIGIGTAVAIQAALVFLVVHSLYKGALFLLAGAIDHSTGTRDVRQLGGLRTRMPVTAVAAALAALSMAGLPPLFGFISKELFYEATLHAPYAPWVMTAVGMLANLITVTIAAVLTLGPFLGRLAPTPEDPHEAPPSLLLGPVLLAASGLALGLLPNTLGAPLVEAAVRAVRAEHVPVQLALWHGWSPVLILSALTVAGGGGLYLARGLLIGLRRTLPGVGRWGPARAYELALAGMLALAGAQTRVLQNGYLRIYLRIIMVTTLGLAGTALISRAGLPMPSWPFDARSYEWIVALLILAAAIATVHSGSRLTAVASLGVVGFATALIYILYGAPDLAKTQFAIETLTVVLFVLVLYRLPRFSSYTTRLARARDLVLALAVGAFMTACTLAVVEIPRDAPLATYFAEASVSLAQGRNIVNVILVDFRALDTLGEITVLSVAAIGVYSLLKLRTQPGKAL